MSRHTRCARRWNHDSGYLTEIAKPKLEDYLAHCDKVTLDLVASFQRAIVEDLVGRTLAAARAYDVATLFVTGGVAANQELRQTFEREAAKEGLPVYFPSRPLSTDNAAMIAAAGVPEISVKEFCCDGFLCRSQLNLAVKICRQVVYEAATGRLH